MSAQSVVDGEVEEEESRKGEGSKYKDGGFILSTTMDCPTATTTKLSVEMETHATARKRGLQKAKERELVRRVARRGVAFGLGTEEGPKRSVEAVQCGKVVESSFAKGEWGIRWRV